MRAVCAGLLAACFLLLTGAVRADDQADAKAIVAKALKAMGGEAKVASFTAGTLKCKVTLREGGREHTLEGEAAWQGLDKIRLRGDLTAHGGTGKIVVVINGDKGWAKKGDQANEAEEGLVPALKHGFYTMRLPHLLPQLKDPAFTLSPQGEQKVDDKDAVGITIAHKDHQDVTLLFDKETGLPVKSQCRITEPGGQEIGVEFLYSDFQEVKGVKHPMKITIKAHGNEFTIEMSEIQPKDKVDDSEFAQP
jgi:hypothetical protein